MMSVLLPGKAVMVLLGETSGRNTGIMLLADSWFSWNTWVMTSSPSRADAAPISTGPDWSLASASGTTLYRSPRSTMAKPC